jgi:acyl transferase domain-containing protein
MNNMTFDPAERLRRRVADLYAQIDRANESAMMAMHDSCAANGGRTDNADRFLSIANLMEQARIVLRDAVEADKKHLSPTTPPA